MPEILLDTNFILNCVKEKVDFFDDLQQKGFHILIADEILKELVKIKNSKKKLHFKQDADIALKIINKYLEEEFVRKIILGGRGYVDNLIIKFLRKHEEIYLGTMDKMIKVNLINRKVVLRARKKIDVL